MALDKYQIAERIAKELKDGYYVNLGIGIPTLVASAKNIIVAMMHTNPKGESKLLPVCSLPLTGVGCVKKIVSDLAVLEVTTDGFKLLERAPGVSVEEIRGKTAGKLIVEGDIPEMSF